MSTTPSPQNVQQQLTLAALAALAKAETPIVTSVELAGENTLNVQTTTIRQILAGQGINL